MKLFSTVCNLLFNFNRKDEESMKTVAIIQARTGSTRLPRKVLRMLGDKPVLLHVVERLHQVKGIDEIIIATTTNHTDEPIVELAMKHNVHYFRGSEENVLSRYYFAAKERGADTVIRFTADCPLIDPFVAEAILEEYLKNDCDIMTNGGDDLTKRTFPRGFDTEVFSFDKLEEAFQRATESYQKEHVTPYIYEHCKVMHYLNETDESHYRLTLDTEEDFELIDVIYQRLYKGKHDFYSRDIIGLLKQEPELVRINAHIEQKKTKQC